MKVVGGKQVGPVYYMVKDVPVLCTIVEQGVVRTSIKAEPTGGGNGSYHYVSFMRDLTKADRNPKRWVYGIQLDGDKLSDRYKISPYCYSAISLQSSRNRVKSLAAYDNGTYTLSLINWPTIEVSKEVFEDIEREIVSDSQHLNQLKHLEVSTGKRSYLGRTVVVKYNYNVPSGGIVLNDKTVSSSTISYLLKHSTMNETEERIWMLDDNIKFIDISGCITGYIEPKEDESIEQAIDAGLLPSLNILRY